MRAYNNYVIVDKLKEEVTSGLFIPDSQNKEIRYDRGTIINFGDKVVGIEVGDIVYYDKFAGHGVKLDNLSYRVIKSDDIVIIE